MKPQEKPVDVVSTYPRTKEVGNFGTLHHSIRDNGNLSDAVFRLLYCLLNNHQDWKINVGFYSNKFGWTRKKQSKVIDELTAHGYLKQERVFAGRTERNPSGLSYQFNA